MHDPLTQAFNIKNPFAKKRFGYRPTLLTIWHRDPEKDGTDDSCGWFKRVRHGDKETFEKIKKEFSQEYKDWFKDGGYPRFSTIGTLIDMYALAVGVINNSGRWHKKAKSFVNKYLLDIIRFAENPIDCIGDSINMKYGVEKPEERISHFASVIYGDILRKQQKWWQHPRWHIHHWEIQFHPLQNFKRRYWDKCCVCGKRGFKSSAIGDWNGTKMWHQECDNTSKMLTLKDL